MSHAHHFLARVGKDAIVDNAPREIEPVAILNKKMLTLYRRMDKNTSPKMLTNIKIIDTKKFMV